MVLCYCVIIYAYSRSFKSTYYGHQIQGMDKMMEAVVRYTHFSINTELVLYLAVIQLVSFFE